jgi:hypothetical protein
MKRYFNYNPERNGVLIMLFVILGISWYYDYPGILLKRPQSVHSWRQCDGASLALNYYQHGMHFFKPEVHLLKSDSGKTGYTAPSEIPVLYYFVASVYSIFGYHDYIFRFINLLIFIIGLLYLFKLGKRVTGSGFWAGTTVILLFSSPLIIFYANNFLPNSTGLALSLMGWYYFYTYYESGNTRTFFVSVVFFLLAACMKITELGGPIIILFLLMADRVLLGKLKLWTDKDFRMKILSIMVIFLLVAGWVFFAKHYNAMHKSSNFLTRSYPIWDLDRDGIRQVLRLVKSLWLVDYYMPLTLYLTGVLTLFNLIFINKMDRIIGISAVIYLAGFGFYLLLWFESLSHHDYFIISLYILPVFILLNFFRFIHLTVKRNILNYSIKAAVVVFVLMNIAYGAKGNQLRYTSAINELPAHRDLHTITMYLRSIGIKPEDRVVFIPEVCIRPLYFMNQPGWFLTPADRKGKGQAISDSLLMLGFLKSGAEYLITNDLASVFQRKSLLAFTKQLVGQHGNVFVFKIPPVKPNFRIVPKEIADIRCDAENQDSSAEYMLYSDLNYKASIGGIVKKDSARSGNFSVLVNERQPYAFTTLIHARPLDIINVKVYCRSDSINCSIACGGEGYPTMYEAKIQEDTGKTGWKCLYGSFPIPSYYTSDSFRIYIWNESGNPVYLDDMEISIVRYGLYKL